MSGPLTVACVCTSCGWRSKRALKNLSRKCPECSGPVAKFTRQPARAIKKRKVVPLTDTEKKWLSEKDQAAVLEGKRPKREPSKVRSPGYVLFVTGGRVSPR